MKKLLLMLFMGILATTGVWANPINLLEEGTPIQNGESLINQEMLDTLNQNEFVQTMTEGYNSIGVQIENVLYVVNIEDNKIVTITKANQIEEVDYTISTNFEEMLYIFANHNKMNRVEILKTLVMDKDVPIQVVMNLAGVFMRGNTNGIQ